MVILSSNCDRQFHHALSISYNINYLMKSRSRDPSCKHYSVGISVTQDKLHLYKFVNHFLFGNEMCCAI